MCEQGIVPEPAQPANPLVGAELALSWQRAGGNGVALVTAKLGGELLAAEKVDLLRPKARADFADRLLKDRPGIDRAVIDAWLLESAGTLAAKLAPAPADSGDEVETGRLVRPELFHTAEVSGIAVPSVRMMGGGPVGRWELHVRWHGSGKRERRPLEHALELPGGGSLWLHPMPSAPAVNQSPGWSAAARRSWLDGVSAPDPCGVFQAVCERLAWFVEFPAASASGAIAAVALWCIFTYVYPASSAVPYLAVGGPMSSGKTTLMRVLARLVFRPLESSSMTAACLFRSLHDCGGVLVLDEAERLRDGSPEAGALRSILLSGYKRGSPAMRLEKIGDRFQRTTFDVFGPKVVGSIAALPEALASRAIRLTMFRAGPESPKPRRRIDAEPERWAALRDDLHALALEHGSTWLALADRSDVVPASLAGRDYELWQPLLALATWLQDRGAVGLLGLVTRFAEQSAEAGRDDAVADADELLLRLLAEHVTAGTSRTLKAGLLLKQATEADPMTFAKWSARGVANGLARYGLRTKKQRGSGGRTYAAVTAVDLHRVEAAYGFDLNLPAEHVPHVPTSTPCTDGREPADTPCSLVHE